VAKGWVCNASPLILFRRITRLDLLKALCGPLIVPGGVLEEVMANPQETQHWETFAKTVEVVHISTVAPA